MEINQLIIRLYCFNTSNIFQSFQQEINEIFTESGLLYKLTDEKVIERIVENTTLTKEMEVNFKAVNEVDIMRVVERRCCII